MPRITKTYRLRHTTTGYAYLERLSVGFILGTEYWDHVATMPTYWDDVQRDRDGVAWAKEAAEKDTKVQLLAESQPVIITVTAEVGPVVAVSGAEATIAGIRAA